MTTLLRLLRSPSIRRHLLRLLRNRHARRAITGVAFRLLGRKRFVRLVAARLRAG
jgi:hypothetical protein